MDAQRKNEILNARNHQQNLISSIKKLPRSESTDKEDIRDEDKDDGDEEEEEEEEEVGEIDFFLNKEGTFQSSRRDAVAE